MRRDTAIIVEKRSSVIYFFRQLRVRERLRSPMTVPTTLFQGVGIELRTSLQVVCRGHLY